MGRGSQQGLTTTKPLFEVETDLWMGIFCASSSYGFVFASLWLGWARAKSWFLGQSRWDTWGWSSTAPARWGLKQTSSPMVLL